VTLVKRPFADTFTFARNIAAQVRDANGALVTAAVNVPRFDHDATGNAKGLLVETGPSNGQHDAIKTVAGWDVGVSKGMVLHEYEQDGELRRIAFYTENVKAMADSCLNGAVHHRTLIVLDGWKRNRGGYVRFDGRNWPLGGALAVQPGPLASPVLVDGEGRILIEG
jgi:hypothetical protein